MKQQKLKFSDIGSNVSKAEMKGIVAEDANLLTIQPLTLNPIINHNL
jgi:hypothetical protein